MAPSAIVMKLNVLLAGPIDSEAKVVYLMAEVRKLLEKAPAAQRPFALNMYCNWALHVALTGKDTITPFLQQVDDYVNGVLVGPEDFGASNRIARDFLELETLRSQLGDFCRANGIRTDLTDDDARWNEFVERYAGVVEDGSLMILAPNHGMKHVKQVTFTKGCESQGEFTQLPFAMNWHVELLNGAFTGHQRKRSDSEGRCRADDWVGCLTEPLIAARAIEQSRRRPRGRATLTQERRFGGPVDSHGA
jgi:hypothetical protein